jgi:hypothetical protein
MTESHLLLLFVLDELVEARIGEESGAKQALHSQVLASPQRQYFPCQRRAQMATCHPVAGRAQISLEDHSSERVWLSKAKSKFADAIKKKRTLWKKDDWMWGSSNMDSQENRRTGNNILKSFHCSKYSR